MRRALQRAHTFHSEPEPLPNVVTTANGVLAQNNHLAATQSKTSSISATEQRRASTNRAKRRERSQTKHLPSTTSAPELPQQLETGFPSRVVRTQIHMSEMLPKVAVHWSKPVSQTPVAGDLHRLASRIIIKDHRAGKNEEFSVKEGDPKEIVAAIISRLCEILEESKTERFIAMVEAAKDSPAEIRNWTESLLSATGEDSKTVAICKTISQNIISPAASQIKIIFAVTNGLIKDFATASDGWRIILHFLDDVITCTHIRKESSVAAGPNWFEFEWSLEIKFPPNLEQIEKVGLSLTGLSCNEAMPKEQRQKLADLMEQMVIE